MRKQTKAFKEHYRKIYEYSHRSVLAFPDDYVVLDLETTGLDPLEDTITEIGMVRVRNQQIVANYSQLVKPEKEISAYIEKKTGITNEAVKDCPEVYDVLSDVLAFIANDPVVGHNIPFDMCFLNQALYPDKCSNAFIDTYPICKALVPKVRHRLSDLVKFFEIHDDLGYHRALSDVIHTQKVFEAMKKVIKEQFGSYQAFINHPQAALTAKGLPLTYAFSGTVKNPYTVLEEDHVFSNHSEMDVRALAPHYDKVTQEALAKAFIYDEKTVKDHPEDRLLLAQIQEYLFSRHSHLSEKQRKDSKACICFGPMDVKDWLNYQQTGIQSYPAKDVLSFIENETAHTKK